MGDKVTDDNTRVPADCPIDPSKFAGRAVSVFERYGFGFITSLLAAGVIGIFTLASTVAKLEERVSTWTRLYETRFEGLDAKVERRFETLDNQLREFRRAVNAKP
jgi:hypothetical protein